MNEKQRRRCEIITRLIANKISSSEASELLGRSSRQVRQMRQRYETLGLETLIHGNQGRPSPRRTEPVLIEQLRQLTGPTGRYHDFNVSHLAELLARDDGIKIPFHVCSLPITFACPNLLGWPLSVYSVSARAPRA